MVLKTLLSGLVVALAATTGCVPSGDDIETRVYEVCYAGVPAIVSRSGGGEATGAVLVPGLNNSNDSDSNDSNDNSDSDDIDLGAAHVGLRTLAISPDSGVDTLRFVDDAHVDVAGQRILDLPGPAAELFGEASAPPNLMPHALDGDLRLTLVFQGDVPPSSWGVRVDACFSVDGVTLTP